MADHVTDSTSWIDIPLQHLPLRPSTLEMLTVAGFERMREVQESWKTGGVANLAAELGLSASDAHSIYREVLEAAGYLSASDCQGSSTTTQAPPTTALELLRKQQKHGSGGGSIITFCRALDQLLCGGIPVGELTELAGPPGTGKTALATQLAVDASLPVAVGGVAGVTVYIDTEGSFSPERCHVLATHLIQHIQAGLKRRQKMNAASVLEASYNVTPEDVLAGIHVFRVHDVSDLTTVLSGSLPEIVHHYHTTAQPVKLVVIDSIAFPFRAADPGSDFIARTRHLTATAAALSELASTYQIAVVAINQMTTKFMSTMNSTGNELNTNNSSMKLVPALGESWAHAVTTRLVLSANEGNQQRICTLTKSPRLPTGSAAFQIVEAGVRGVEYTHSSKRQRTEDPQ